MNPSTEIYQNVQQVIEVRLTIWNFRKVQWAGSHERSHRKIIDTHTLEKGTYLDKLMHVYVFMYEAEGGMRSHLGCRMGSRV